MKTPRRVGIFKKQYVRCCRIRIRRMETTLKMIVEDWEYTESADYISTLDEICSVVSLFSLLVVLCVILVLGLV